MKKILVVEDDTYIRDVYEEVLKGAGYDVTTAIDGEEGLLKVREGGYDLVLLDIMMPKMNGVQLLTDLQKHPAAKENKAIVLLTNMAEQQVLDEGMKLGAKHYLVKSDLTPDQFLEQVKKFLS